jgi:hypothetical protein
VDDEDDNDNDNNNDDDDDNNNDDNNNDNDNNIMAPKVKSPPKPKSPAKTPQKVDADDTLVSSVKKLKITGPMVPSSVTTNDVFIVKNYTHKFKDYCEVDIFVNGVLPRDGYKAELSEDGMSLKWRKGIPDYFYETKRMMTMLGKEYHPNDTRVIAHDNVGQQIRRGGTENQGLHFAGDEQAQIIQLNFRCTGNPRVKESLQRCEELIVSGNTHFQFNTIYTCRMLAMEQRSAQKKKAVRSVFVDAVGALSDDDDSDADDPMNVTRVNPMGSMSPYNSDSDAVAILPVRS